MEIATIPLWLSAAGTAATVAGGVMQYNAAQDAKKNARRAADMEARTTAEKARVLAESNQRRESLAKAKAGAAGLSGLSTDVYIDALQKVGREELSWLKEVGASNYAKQLEAGQGASNQSMAGFWGSLGQTTKMATDWYNLTQ